MFFLKAPPLGEIIQWRDYNRSKDQCAGQSTNDYRGKRTLNVRTNSIAERCGHQTDDSDNENRKDGS